MWARTSGCHCLGGSEGAEFENKQVCLDKVTGRGPGVAGRTHPRAARLEYSGPYWRCASRGETRLISGVPRGQGEALRSPREGHGLGATWSERGAIMENSEGVWRGDKVEPEIVWLQKLDRGWCRVMT